MLFLHTGMHDAKPIKVFGPFFEGRTVFDAECEVIETDGLLIEPFACADELSVTESDYRNVTAQLGIDPDTGKGDWPTGLITHLGGMTEDGRGVIVESWTSREAQVEFMQSRLGPAQAQGGVTAMPKVTWANLVGEYLPGGG